MTRARVSLDPRIASDAERLLCQFDQAWQSGAAPRIDAFLVAPAGVTNPAGRRQLLEELIKIDLEYRWRTGQRLSASGGSARLEDYFSGYPELGPVERLPLALIEEEYRARHCWGDRPAHAEYLERFSRQGPPMVEALKRIDAELASERLQGGPGLPPGDRTLVIPQVVAEPPAALVSLATLVDQLRNHRLLSQNQLTELERGLLRNGAADARTLAADLLRRSWLTPYQVNQLLVGRGAELVLGPYVLLERLGEGGTGQVFKARHHAMDRFVAVKRIRRELLVDAEVLRRFYREIQLISQLSHPNIVHALDAGPIGTAHVLVTEYVEGTDLSRLVKQGGPLPIDQACAYIRQAALGLQHLHERGLVHRDIKPSNMLLVKAGPSILKILDLGLSRFYRNEDGELTSTMTPEGPVTMGTADYMAPEQALDFHGADIRADIYSLGCTFFYLLTGQPPYPGGSLAQKLLRHQQTEVPAVERLRPDVPSAVAAVLRRMLAKTPADRYQGPAEVAQALAPLVGSAAAAQGARRAVWGRLKRLATRRRVLTMGLAAGLLVAAWMLFTPGQRLATPKSYFHLWPEEPVEVLCQRSGRVRCVAISPDGHFVVCAGEGDSIGVWEVSPRRELFSLKGYKGNISALAISADGQMLASGGDNVDGAVVRLWDLTQREEKAVLKGHGVNVYALAFSADGKTLASAGWEGTVKIWDVDTAKLRHSLAGHKGHLLSVAFAPTGGTVLSAAYDRAIMRWDADAGTGKTLASVNGGSSNLAIAPDGKRFAVADNRTVRFFDIHDGKDQGSLTGIASSIVALAYAADGKTLAAADEQGQVLAWDLASRAKPQEWRLPKAERSPATCLAFAGDSRHLVTAQGDTVYILRLAPAEK